MDEVTLTARLLLMEQIGSATAVADKHEHASPSVGAW
jgi:hypothetical protein